MDRPSFYILFILLFVLTSFPSKVYCEQSPAYVQAFAQGSIDWTNLVFMAKGRSAASEESPDVGEYSPQHVEKAVEKARQNLLSVIFHMRVDAATELHEIANADHALKSKIVGMVKKAKVIEQRELPDGSFMVKIEMPITGGFSQLVLPDSIIQLQSIKPMPPPEINLSEENPDASETVDAESLKSFSGLIIHASNIKAVPALAPRVLDEQGEQVYGASYVSREFAVQNGVCGYTKSLESAMESKRVADNPIVVKGLRTNGPALSDIIISNADASKIRGSSENLTFLKKCRVIMVIDE